MSDLRKAAQQALEFVTSEVWGKTPYMDVCVYEDAARLRDALRAALAQEQEQKQKLLEAVRVRIMSTAYDCADDGEVEAYNSVKVLCTELLEMLK